MEKIFVAWHDFDGPRLEEFETVKQAEEFLAPIYAKSQPNGDGPDERYGTTIDAVIQGKRLEIEPVETVTKIKIVGESHDKKVWS